MVKEFNNLKEIKKYYDRKTNTYVFKEDNKYIDLVVFNFDLNIKSNIYAQQLEVRNINACNINAWNVNAWNIRASRIRARDINANDINSFSIVADNINYFAVCFAYENIKCKSIKGRRENAEHFVLDGKIEIAEEN